MAHVTGTASSLRDTLEQIRTVLKTNALLASATPTQAWNELRYVADNVEMADTNMTLFSGKNIQMMLRAEPRMRYVDSDTTSTPDTQFSNFVGGTSFIRWKLRAAKAVTKISVRTHSSTANQNNLRTFRLQYSDDGVAWTTVQTFSNLSWGVLEDKEFTGWAATGAHLWWRILIDTNGTGQTSGSIYIRRLLCYDGVELVNSSSSETYLKGPGLAGADEIFIGFRTIQDPINSWYLLQVFGFTGFLANEISCMNQPGGIAIGAAAPFLALWDNPMPFWITANGRRVIFVFKVSTVYEGGYAGFFLPYATASQYPYPLAIGGSMAANSSNGFKYDLVHQAHSVFCMPGSNTTQQSGLSAITTFTDGTLIVMQPTGVWEAYANRPNTSNQSESIVRRTGHAVYPHGLFNSTFVSSGGSTAPMNDNVGGGYLLMPHTLYNENPKPSRFLGELDGTKHISGQNNGSENTGTFQGTPYVIFQNTYRTAKSEYWAMLAE